jgi:periplasmic protein TonB
VKRLAFAAALALGLHAVLLWIHIPWSRPALPLATRQPVDIDLAVFEKPVEAPRPPATKPIQPHRKPKPVIKPITKPKPPPKAIPPLKPVIRQQPKVEKVVAPPTKTAPPEPVEAQVPADPPSRSAPVDSEPAQAPEAAVVAPAVIQNSRPRYDLNPSPEYPRLARRRNYQGTVLLDVRVSVQGRVAELKVARSSGYRLLDQSALNAVRRWIFDPALRNGEPVETWVQVPVRFELE